MSGGSLNYAYQKLLYVWEDIIEKTSNPLYVAFARRLPLIANALHDIEWEMSGDSGEHDAEPAVKAALGGEWKAIVLDSAVREIEEIRDEVIRMMKGESE